MPKYFEDMGSDVLARLIKILGSDAILPFDAQATYNVPDTQLSAKAITATSTDTSAVYLDVKQFSRLGIKVKAEASDAMQVDLYWSEDQTVVDSVQNIFSGTAQWFNGEFPVLGSYVKVVIKNTGSATHTYDAKTLRKVQ